MPHSVKTYRKRAEAQRREAVLSSNGSRINHLELAEIFRARADLIDALSLPEQASPTGEGVPR